MAKIHWLYLFYLKSKWRETWRILRELSSKFEIASEKSKKSVNFLDVKVSLIDKHLEIDLYCKPTNCHQFLDFSSVHNINIQKSTVYSSDCALKDYVLPM